MLIRWLVESAQRKDFTTPPLQFYSSLNHERLYQRSEAGTNDECVPEGPQRKIYAGRFR